MTDPDLLRDPGVRTYFEPGYPICVLLCGVLHHIADRADSARVVRGWVAAFPPGSFLVLTHLFDPGPGDNLHKYAQSCQPRYLEALGSGWFRTYEQIEGFFDGLRLVTPACRTGRLVAGWSAASIRIRGGAAGTGRVR